MRWNNPITIVTEEGATYALSKANFWGWREVTAKGTDRLGQFPSGMKMKIAGAGTKRLPYLDFRHPTVGVPVVFRLQGKPARYWTTLKVTEIKQGQ